MSRFVMPLQSAFGQRVVPFDGAKLFFFATGTSNPKDTFSVEALTPGFENTNPVIANADGRFPDIFLESGKYKVQLKDKNDVQEWEEDPVVGIVDADVINYLQGDTGSVIRTVESRLQDFVSAKDFGVKGDGATDDSTNIQAALTATTGGKLFFPAGTYIFDAEVAGVSNITICGAGVDATIFQAKTTIGQNNLLAFATKENVTISDITFDMRNDAITPILTSAFKENALFFLSCTKIVIEHCKFRRSIKRDIQFNATVSDETQDVYIRNNEFLNGSQGAINSARFGRNVHVYENTLTNTVDSSVGTITFEKPISLSGQIAGHIHHNEVLQTNGEGGSVIVEFQDRQSENIRIHNNDCRGQNAGNNIKVGGAIDVQVYSNTCVDALNNNIRFEGCTDFDAYNNWCEDAGDAAIRGVQDVAPTTRDVERGRIYKNTIKNANKNANTLGAPDPVGGADGKSFGIFVDGTTADDIKINSNIFIDDGDTFNGILINGTDYEIMWNDFDKLNANRIPIDNHFAPSGTYWKILDNRGAQTTNSGKDTILNTASSVVVSTDILAQFDPRFVAFPDGPLSGTAIYLSGTASTAPDVGVNPRTSAHAIVAATADIDFNWSVDNSEVARGIFAKTVR